MDKDSLDYVGSIEDSIRYKNDIRDIQVWINQGLKEADFDHKIIKALGFLNNSHRSQSPIIMPLRDK
jgi:hypothetical protein